MYIEIVTFILCNKITFIINAIKICIVIICSHSGYLVTSKSHNVMNEAFSSYIWILSVLHNIQGCADRLNTTLHKARNV